MPTRDDWLVLILGVLMGLVMVGTVAYSLYEMVTR